ncbi:aldehyde-activating protein [Burkholderia ubonensis]|uniref:Aldehyde-activating protein n=1 Tax=Burkholderia ubonensis TaxID=101571 RepID=A0A103R5Y4_9BURK|nr:GFA family protein [Burkholderia ubonensis]AOJ64879.1 aldehyde-activating protein [Burkholderia ubonensis]KVG61839.1 aldehyde-activating protein [Burkholderia ubonensis]
MTVSTNYVHGQCHCGAVRFRIRQLPSRQAIECNCSICFASGFLHVPVARDDFELLDGAGQLTSYRFNKGIAQHTFCRVCGVKPFYRPRSHPDDYSVNLRCLDLGGIESFAIVPFDGRNWEDNIRSFPQ